MFWLFWYKICTIIKIVIRGFMNVLFFTPHPSFNGCKCFYDLFLYKRIDMFSTNILMYFWFPRNQKSRDLLYTFWVSIVRDCQNKDIYFIWPFNLPPPPVQLHTNAIIVGVTLLLWKIYLLFYYHSCLLCFRFSRNDIYSTLIM